MGARNRVGIGLSYRPARLQGWRNRFAGSLKVLKNRLRVAPPSSYINSNKCRYWTFKVMQWRLAFTLYSISCKEEANLILPCESKLLTTCVNYSQRDGWPLLPVESEANGVSRSTYERAPFLIGLFNSACRYKRFLSCLGCSTVYSSVQNIFSSSHNFSLFVSPSPSKPGWQLCRIACLCVSV